MNCKLVRVGDDRALVFDEEALDAVGLKEGDEVEITTDGATIIVTPMRPQENAP
jgi:antitoxin component of MazEF toxin-antitoxin module